ncbi:LysR family transcriptional regulator [Halomonas sp. M1]|uniref:LysR family transcriptional regulator n=1 Tax=Halomonas sp. M1 TaxID=3035470 RepID=UPI00248625F0|nr:MULTISPECIES: LysR family transcriptional regulator [unclassified Halomonas]MDP3535526.1 LysR family transcriptional regulator [Halomonas sp.]WFE72745.1 LysR family transcriptional regulator [Halomonas sp. M1]
MRAEQVQAFIDVTEHGSFAAAARHTGIKRSTLSAAVNALEDSLGVELFERSGNSLQLSAVGESVLPDCYRLLTSASRIKKHCQQHMQGVENQLCIARDDALPEAFWRQVMHDLKQRYPLTAISVYLLPPQEHPQFVSRQTVDIAFGLYTAEGASVDASNLAPVSMCLVAAPTHPLSRLLSVNRDDLAQYTQVCLTYDQGDKLVSEALFSTNYLGLTMFEVIRDAAINGTGWALLPYPLVKEALEEHRLCALNHDLALESHYYRYVEGENLGVVATALLNSVTRFLGTTR